MDYKIGQFGSLVITDQGDVFNTETNRLLSLFSDNKGNPVFRSPDTKSNWRLDYVVAMLFLNNAEFISDIKGYYIKHLDGDPKNCNLENLELITDPDEVKELRFGFLKNNKRDNSERLVWPLYVADRDTGGIETYSIKEFAKKFKISESCAVKKAKNCERVYKNSSKLWVCETMLEAFYCL